MNDDKDIRPFLPPVGKRLVLPAPDPRDPDPTRKGMFILHRCSKCNDGEQACAEVYPTQCSYPRARNE